MKNTPEKRRHSARRWHKNSVFGDGPRVPMCRERRAVWKARIEIHRRAGKITDGESFVGLALLKRLGNDGRCDPSHQTLADDSGQSISTVQRALKAILACGMVLWVMRKTRNGWHACQTSNAYLLTLGEPAKVPLQRYNGQTDRGTFSKDFIAVAPDLYVPSEAEAAVARDALAQRRRVVEASLLTRGNR